MSKLTGMLHSDMPIDWNLSLQVAPVSVPQKGKILPIEPDRLPLVWLIKRPINLFAASREVPVGLMPKGNLGPFHLRGRCWPLGLQLLCLLLLQLLP